MSTPSGKTCGCCMVPCTDADPSDLCSEATGMNDGVNWYIAYCPLHAQGEKLFSLAKILAEQDWITPDVSPTGAYLVEEARAILRAVQGK